MEETCNGSGGRNVATFKMQGVLYAIAVLLSNYSFLNFVELDQAADDVVIWTVVFYALELVAAGYIFFFRNPHRSVQLLALLYIIDQFIVGLPRSNHHIVLLLFSFLILTIYSATELSRATRWLVFTFYLFASFHKLNTDFFTPAFSCATFFYRNTLESFFGAGVNSPLQSCLPFLVISAELAIPVLIIFRRTRIYGVLLGLVFHLFLALDIPKHFFDFSAVMGCLLLVAAGPSILEQLHLYVRDSKRRRIWIPYFISLLILTVAVTSFSFAALFTIADDLTASLLIIGASLLLLLIAPILYALVDLNRLKLITIERETTFSNFHALVSGLVLFCTVVIGLGPYLGVRTRFSFDMYSNLNISQLNSNHLIVSRSADIFGYLAGTRAPTTYFERAFVTFRPTRLERSEFCRW